MFTVLKNIEHHHTAVGATMSRGSNEKITEPGVQAAKGVKVRGTRLRELREARRLSLREASRQAGVSPSYLSGVETGAVGSPSHEILSKLAAVYAIDAEELAKSLSVPPDFVMGVPADRIDWAIDCMVRDPVLASAMPGLHTLANEWSVEAKALVVLLYQYATGRQLLTFEEKGGLDKVVGDFGTYSKGANYALTSLLESAEEIGSFDVQTATILAYGVRLAYQLLLRRRNGRLPFQIDPNDPIFTITGPKPELNVDGLAKALAAARKFIMEHPL